MAAVVHHLGTPMLLSNDPVHHYTTKDKERYPLGDFEDTQLTLLLNSMIFDRDPDLARQLRTKERAMFNPTEKMMLTTWLMTRIAEAHEGRFGIKKPVLCMVIKPFVELLHEGGHSVKAIHAERPVEDRIKSYLLHPAERPKVGDYRSWVHALQWYNEWRITQCMCWLGQLHVPVITVQHDDLLNDTVTTVQRVADFIGTTMKEEAVNAVKSRVETHPKK
jgi:hypothetical protein